MQLLELCAEALAEQLVTFIQSNTLHLGQVYRPLLMQVQQSADRCCRSTRVHPVRETLPTKCKSRLAVSGALA